MTPDPTHDQALAAFFAAQVPPPRDLAFEARVAAGVARRRALATVLALVPWTIAAVAVLWALAPLVAPVVEGLGQTLAPAVALLVLTALTVAGAQAAGRGLKAI